jgi:O-antigen/teichoic acid export membrane protein
MSRSRRILEGFSVGIAGQTLMAIGGLVVTRYVLPRIGARDYGLWIVAGQFLAYLSLLDLGITALVPRDVALITGKNTDEATRSEELRRLVGRSVSLVLLLVPPLTIGAIAIVALLPRSWSDLKWPLAIAMGTFVLSYPLRLAHALLLGLQDFAYLSWVQIASWIANVTLTVVLAHLRFGLYAVALGPALGQLTASASWVVRIFQRHRHVLPDTVRSFDRDALRAHLRPGAWVSLNQIALLLLNNTDTVIIGRLMGPQAVLPYAFTDKLETFFNNQPYAIVTLSGPAISEVRALGETARLVRAISALSAVALAASGGLALGIIAMNRAFVRAWVGEQYWGGMTLNILLVANMLVRHWVFTFGIALFYLGHERACTLLAIVDGLLTLGLTIVFVRHFGIVGAPMAALTSVIVVHTLVPLTLLAREMGVTIRHLVADSARWVVRFLPLASLATAMNIWRGPQTLAGVVTVDVVVLGVYALVMLQILRRPPLDSYARPYLAKLGL